MVFITKCNIIHCTHRLRLVKSEVLSDLSGNIIRSVDREVPP